MKMQYLFSFVFCLHLFAGASEQGAAELSELLDRQESGNVTRFLVNSYKEQLWLAKFFGNEEKGSEWKEKLLNISSVSQETLALIEELCKKNIEDKRAALNYGTGSIVEVLEAEARLLRFKLDTEKANREETLNKLKANYEEQIPLWEIVRDSEKVLQLKLELQKSSPWDVAELYKKDIEAKRAASHYGTGSKDEVLEAEARFLRFKLNTEIANREETLNELKANYEKHLQMGDIVHNPGKESHIRLELVKLTSPPQDAILFGIEVYKQVVEDKRRKLESGAGSYDEVFEAEIQLLRALWVVNTADRADILSLLKQKCHALLALYKNQKETVKAIELLQEMCVIESSE